MARINVYTIMARINVYIGSGQRCPGLMSARIKHRNRI